MSNIKTFSFKVISDLNADASNEVVIYIKEAYYSKQPTTLR